MNFSFIFSHFLELIMTAKVLLVPNFIFKAEKFAIFTTRPIYQCLWSGSSGNIKCNYQRRKFSLVARYSLKIHLLLVARCKITFYLLQSSLVTHCKFSHCSLLVAKHARYLLQKLVILKNSSLLISEFKIRRRKREYRHCSAWRFRFSCRKKVIKMWN